MTSRSINWNYSIKSKINRLNNSSIFVNECTPKLENIKQSYDWRLECPLLRFTPALVGKLMTRFSFDFPTLTHVSKEWILEEFIHMTQFGMTEKRKILTSWKHQCETCLICFQSDSTKSICFGEKSKLCNTWRFLWSYFIFKIKAKFSVIRKPYNSLFCSDLW